MEFQPLPGDLVPIEPDRCIELLASAPWVRIGFLFDGAPVVLPVNIVLHDEAIYYRTAPGSKLGSAADTGAVAVEADGGDPSTRIGWSVMAHGQASIVTDREQEEALLGLPFEPWALPGDKPFWVRIEVLRISGRRIVRS